MAVFRSQRPQINGCQSGKWIYCLVTTTLSGFFSQNAERSQQFLSSRGLRQRWQTDVLVNVKTFVQQKTNDFDMIPTQDMLKKNLRIDSYNNIINDRKPNIAKNDKTVVKVAIFAISKLRFTLSQCFH